MQEQGYVTNVIIVASGSEAAVDAFDGETYLTLQDAYAFNEAGGQFTVDEDPTPIQYTAVDAETGLVTITSPLPFDILENTPVYVYPRGSQKVAMVQFDDNDEGVRAIIPFTMTDRFDDGIRDINDMESVFISDESGRWEVTAVDEEIPNVSGEYIDPTTLPEPEAPEAPVASPVLKAIGMPTSIMLVTEPIAGTDSLTYQISDDNATWFDLDNMPTKQTIWTATDMPFVGPLEVGVTYWFRVIAGNSAGSAPPSNVEDEQLNTSAIALIASQVITAELISEAIQAGIVRVGSNITISADGGIEILQSDGGVTRLPSDGSSPVFTGEIVARSLKVENGASIYGESDVSGSIELNAAINDPLSAPTTDAYWDVRDLGQIYWTNHGSIPSVLGLCRNLANTGWVTIAYRPDLPGLIWDFVEVLDTNVVNRYHINFSLPGVNAIGGGITAIAGKYYFFARTSTATWHLCSIASISSGLAPTTVWFASAARSSRPAIGNDGTDLLVASLEPGDVGTVRIDTVDTSVSIISTDFYASGLAAQQDITGVYRGNADYGSTRIFVQYTTGIRVFNTTPVGVWDGTYVSADGWPRPYNWNVNGLHWDGTYFRSVDPYARITRLEPKAALTASWWAYTWIDSDTHTTLPSPRKQWTPPNRSLVTVTSATPPQLGDAGTHVADRIQVYAASSAVATLYKQGGALAAGIVAWPYNPIREVVTVAPVANNWAGIVTPGEFRSNADDALSNIILMKGDGSGRTGDRSWDENGAPVHTGLVPAISLYKVGGQSIVANTTTVVAMDTQRYSGIGDGGMELVSGVVQVPVMGWYQVSGNISWAASTSSARRFLWIGRGSTTAIADETTMGNGIAWAQDASNIVMQTTSALVFLGAGEYVGLKCHVTVNYGLEVSQTYMNNLTVHWVG